jgi:putative flavoprotein involved in K+ transport
VERADAIIVGAGQAGLAVSHELSASGVEHALLERGRVGESWRHRHDSFCLVTPNWTVGLPGHRYAGPEPDGFMVRDEIVATLEDYARSFNAPVQSGVMVTGVEPQGAGGFLVRTRAGDIRCRAVVLATGTFQRVHRPAAVESLPPALPRFDSDSYRNEAALPPGRVLIIGSGQSGAQIAEELRLAGREVVLACGKVAWVPRRLGEKDIVWWLDKVGFFNQTTADLPSPAARLTPNPVATGHSGGHDLHVRILQAIGVTLTGHFLGVENGKARFAQDLPESVAWGDERHRELLQMMKSYASGTQLDLPPVDDLEPFCDCGPEELDISGFNAVIVTGGYRPGYHIWLRRPEAFDELGFPLQEEGQSTVIPGLFFAGVHFQRARKSALLLGVGEDASVVSLKIRDYLSGK